MSSLASFLLWLGVFTDLLVLLFLLTRLCRGASSGPSRECTPLYLPPNRVKTFLSPEPSLVNTVALTGLLWRVGLSLSCLSLENTLEVCEGRVPLDSVTGLCLLFLGLFFLSHDSDSENCVCEFRCELSPGACSARMCAGYDPYRAAELMLLAAVCRLYLSRSDSNSTLKNHISHPHCEALKRAAKPGQSFMSQDGSLFVYNPDVLREQFAGLVIQRGLPFNHFDDEQTTRVFQKHLQPKYNHISRTTLKRDAIKLWVAAKQVIIDDFLKLSINVNLATDVWSAPHRVLGSYICVTAHWIEPVTWKMMKRVMAFEEFPAPHSGSALAKKLRNVFVNFNLENKIMSITLDNASNNTSAIDKLKLKYDPPMDASESAFSTSGRVLSIERTRLAPASLEMCMCLKDHLDPQERKQDKSTLETPVDFKEEILDAEVQANEAIPLSDEEIALDAASSGRFYVRTRFKRRRG
uniref:Zinc finger BED domain-containing protein RICESLEEPER 2-like n=1 Tax=Tanacetum cinerariifolium TaxID=118510 RepID=A0A6L2JC49_TANCI|nr:zinc finger BED domain-containing protein RICESLEEPER 2-like [Tanacetum cinerariifolium]